LFIGPLIALYTNSPYRQQDSKCLANLVIKTRRTDFRNVDVISVLRDLDLFAGDRAKDADRKTWPGEGMTVDKVSGDVEEAAESADFVCSMECM